MEFLPDPHTTFVYSVFFFPSDLSVLGTALLLIIAL